MKHIGNLGIIDVDGEQVTLMLNKFLFNAPRRSAAIGLMSAGTFVRIHIEFSENEIFTALVPTSHFSATVSENIVSEDKEGWNLTISAGPTESISFEHSFFISKEFENAHCGATEIASMINDWVDGIDERRRKSVILLGKLDRLTYEGEDYFVYSFKAAGGNRYSAIYEGKNPPKVRKTVQVQLNGEWVYHRRYGKQIKIESVQKNDAKTVNYKAEKSHVKMDS